MEKYIINFFLTFKKEFYNSLSDEQIKKQIFFIEVVLNLDGIINIEIGYCHPISNINYLLKHEIILVEEDFKIYIKNKKDFFELVTVELIIILTNIFTGLCSTTCNKCELSSCSCGKLLTNKEVLKLKEIFNNEDY